MKWLIEVKVHISNLEFIKNKGFDLQRLLEEAVEKVLNMPFYQIINCGDDYDYGYTSVKVWIDDEYMDIWEEIPESFKPYIYNAIDEVLFGLYYETQLRIEEVKKHENTTINR